MLTYKTDIDKHPFTPKTYRHIACGIFLTRDTRFTRYLYDAIILSLKPPHLFGVTVELAHLQEDADVSFCAVVYPDVCSLMLTH